MSSRGRVPALATMLATAALVAAPAWAAPPQGAGAALFETHCAACHGLDRDPGKMGPALRGVLGRKAGSLSGYAFSDGLRRAGLVWTPRTLDAFLASPQAIAPGSRMPVSVSDAANRAALISYLEAEGSSGRPGTRPSRIRR